MDQFLEAAIKELTQLTMEPTVKMTCRSNEVSNKKFIATGQVFTTNKDPLGDEGAIIQVHIIRYKKRVT